MNRSRGAKKKKIFYTVILSIGASLHLTANDCLLDCSSFRYRRFYFTTATTSITATATTTATAPTRRPSLRDVCLATTTTERARVAAERSSRERTQKKRNDHHLLHTIPPPPTNQPTNYHQPPLHVHSCLVEVSQSPQEIIDSEPQPRSPFTFGLPRQTLDPKSSGERERERKRERKNGSTGRKTEIKMKNRARDNAVKINC
ncbi:uncharacterized protein LOC126854435 isoform X1 [Cataglyphis hispanica]|uniref:uncharacterized protein LOC126854435 isoform X1 n=1 Tax=Cataglyphis hispanica TaxID=1086592 RepID=UPI0021801B61|nr:uncharacterized protein LOC126854435 isoform X1 [Cataglyphis hispanica]